MNKEIGFSLIELAVTVSVLALLLSMAVPGFQSMTRNNALTTQVNGLVSALNSARSEAIKRGLAVSVCRSSNGSSCGSDPWDSGWIVFVNDDDDSPAAVDGGEEILRIYPRLKPGFTLRPSNNFKNFVTYMPDGDANQQGRFVFCWNSDLEYARAVFINSIGRIVLAPDDNRNGIPEDGSGADISACTP